jgi:hypothetical protein
MSIWGIFLRFGLAIVRTEKLYYQLTEDKQLAEILKLILTSKPSTDDISQKDSSKLYRSLTDSVTSKGHLKPTSTYTIRKEIVLSDKSPRGTENESKEANSLE